MDICNLVDLGASGPLLTWSSGRDGMARTLVRLDRAIASSDWRLLFAEASVTNLPRTTSDHCLLLLNTNGMNFNFSPNFSNRPFRMLACWFDHHDFLKDNWSNNADLHTNIINFTGKVRLWNKYNFGNIF